MITIEARTAAPAASAQPSSSLTWRRTSVVLLLALLATLVPLPQGTPLARAGLGDLPEIIIGPGGFVRGGPAMQLRRGDVVWSNESGGPLTITSPNGLLESGEIPDRGAFAARLDYPGTYAWETELVSGVITIPGQLSTDDGPDARAVEAIPALAFPPRQPEDIVEHPISGMPVARSRMLVGFTDDATVQEASGALSRARVDIVGGLPRLGVVLVDRGSTFAQTQQALESLRGEDAVAFATAEFLETEATLPAPSRDLFEPFGWTWDSPVDHPLGRRGNWGLELSRVPAAWNLNETTQRRLTRPVDIAVVDSGFEDHENLSRLQQLELCRTELQISGTVPVVFNCTLPDPSDHGNHVAGIIGADHDNRTADGRSIGRSGVDPFSNLIGINRRWETPVADGLGVDALDASQPQAFEELLAAAEDGTVPDLRVINSSNQLFYGGTENWIARWADETCGPGSDDDETGTGPCLPDTQDDHLREIAEYGKLSRRVVERFVERLDPAPVFVASAGNLSDDLCVPLASSCAQGDRVPLAATAGSSLAWAAANWQGDAGANPIVVVESIGLLPGGSLTPSTARSPFSNVGGDISAPGLAISASSSQAGTGTCAGAGADGYCYQGGTSQAAPFVAGALGLWLSYDPSLTLPQLRSLLLDWAIDDTTDGAAPRIDVFRPLQSLPGAARALADLSDPSPDGNRRVVRAADGTTSLDTQLSSEPDAMTAPDGAVDMRDFRRFRDAWLAQCLLGGDDGCPDTVVLDGPLDHPKRDLNGDGCIGWEPTGPDQTCPSETVFNRFDLNGDGVVSRTRTAPVGIRSDGGTASGPADAAVMTDLEVLASQWDTGSEGAEGVLAGELDGLLVSGDVELHLDGLDATGATEATIEVVDTRDTSALWSRTVPLDGNARVVTVPADVPVELRIGAAGDDASIAISTPTVTLAPGEDRRVDACGTLLLEADRTVLEPGGSTSIQAEVGTCGAPVEGIEIDLDLQLSAADVASLSSTTLTTDAQGRASATVTAGDLDGEVTIAATAEVPTLADATTTVARSARVGLRVGAPYALDTLAIEAADGSWDLSDPQASAGGTVVPTGTSINRHGDVAFTARVVGSDHDDLFVIPGDSTPPAAPVPIELRRSGAEMTAGQRARGAAQINDDGGVAVIWSALTDGVLQSELRRYTADDTEVLVTGEASIGAPDTDYGLLDHPTLSNTGQVVVRATRNSDDADVLLSTQLAGISEGAETPFARPRVADDGTVVTPAVTNEGRTDDRGLPLLETLLLVGDGDHASGRQVLARTGAGQPWRSIGDAHLSDQGRAVVFVGDRGDGPGLFLSLRGDDDTWSEPLPVLGENATGGDDELGAGPAEDPRYLVDVTGQPGVLEADDGSSGRLLLAFRGTPNVGSAGAAGTESIWTVPVDTDRSSDEPGITVGVPTPVLSVGTSLAGSTVTALRMHDPLAAGGTAADPDAHRLAMGVRLADDRLAVLRADWLGGPAPAARIERTSLHLPLAATATAGADAPSPLLAAAGPDDTEDVPPADPLEASAEAIAASDVDIVDGPHIAAMTLAPVPSDLGDTYTIVNRSRELDGTPAPAVFDARVLAPDEAVSRTLPSEGDGTFFLKLGAPIVSSPWTSIVTVRLRVGSGPGGPPVADAGGPYLTDGTAGLRLDPSGSTPTDAAHAWDLDGDGTYELPGPDRLGPTELSSDQVANDICGGTCVEGDTYTIGLEVSTPAGTATDDAEVTITGPQDVTLLVNPQTARIDPGGQSTVWLTLDPVNGFNGTVELETQGVPEGWTVTHASSAVVPSFVGFRIQLPSDTPTDQQFSFDIVARAGEIEQVAEVRVAPGGLLRERFATLSGTVVDAATDDPLGGLFVRTELGNEFVPADGDGTFTTSLRLSAGSQVERITVEAELFGYAPFRRELLIREDDDLNIDIALEPYDRGAVTARVVEGRFNPVDPGTPIPTDTPISGVTVSVTDIDDDLTTDADGRVTSPDEIRIQDPTQPRSVTVVASADGYWTTQTTGLVRGGEVLDLGDLALLEQCDATLGEVRVVDQLGDPIPDSTVRVLGFGVSEQDVTDEQGRVVFDTDLPLRTYNEPLALTATAFGPASWPGSAQGSTTIQLQRCGDRSADATIVLERPEVLLPTTGAAEGTVTDAQTGEPIADASIRIETRDSVLEGWGAPKFASTDSEGRWARDDLRVAGGSTTALARVRVVAAGYLEGNERFGIETDGTTTVDVALLPQRFGTLTGVVRDIDTGEPVPGVSVRALSGLSSRTEVTDDEGRYLMSGLPAASDPTRGRGYLVTARTLFDRDTLEPRYWSALGGGILFPETTTTVDLYVLEACLQGAVSGVVRDAESDTLEPIEGARVSIRGLEAASTDADGRYRIEGVPVAEDNGSNNVTVTADAEGFFETSTLVRVYCGAEITADFGGGDGGTGVVTGTVTDPDGDPVEGVFIGSGWGEADSTAPDGTYRLDDAPLAAGGGDREWVVSARHRREQQDVNVTVLAGDDPTIQDFVVGAGNRAPQAIDQSVETAPGQGVPVLLEATDPDGDALARAITAQPEHGRLVFPQGGENGPLITYRPDEGFLGTDMFTFEADDGLATSGEATVTVVVTEEPSPPGDDDPPGEGEPDEPGEDEPGEGDPDPGDGDEGADNRPPTARIAAVSPVAEGDTLQLDATASDDPDGDELTFSWELEDGRAFDGPVVEIPTDDDLSVVATVTVDDGRGGTDTAEVLLLASNVAPSVAVDTVAVGDGDAVPPSTGSDAHPVEVTVGETIAVAASFVDPGLGDTHVARVVWGDGSVDATDLAAGERAVDGSHTFDDPGDVTVTVEVCDDDGGCGDRSFPVRVRAVVPPPEDDDAPGGDEPPAEEPDAEPDDGPVGEAPPSEPDEQPDAAVDDGPVAETPTSETDDTPQESTPSLPTPPGSEGLPAADVEVLGSRQERGERIAVPADTVELSRTGGPLRSLVTLGVLLLLFGGALVRVRRISPGSG